MPMPIKASLLKAIFPIAKYEIQSCTSLEQLKYQIHFNYNRGDGLLPEIQDAIDKVAEMCWEVKSGESHVPSVSSHTQKRSWFSTNVPSVTYVDNSWNWGSNNTTYNTPGEPRKKKETSLEEYLIGAGIMVAMAIVTGIAAVSFGNLFSEICNHASHFFNNEGSALGASLLIGMGVSYGLAMFTLYELVGGLLMTAMVAGAFANPAVWAFAAIALSAIIVMPLFNMFVREGIYSAFSLFDKQALVENDGRFRMLDDTELDNLPSDIDPDRVHFATLCQHASLRETQVRQRFAFFDYNSEKMDGVLKDVRAMRNDGKDSVAIELETGKKKTFSLFKSQRAPSAPPIKAEIPVVAVAVAVAL